MLPEHHLAMQDPEGNGNVEVRSGKTHKRIHSASGAEGRGGTAVMRFLSP